MKKLKIAIQKSGRLHEKSVELLSECGIKFRHSKNQLRSVAINFPIEVLFLRDDDIPQYVEDGVADLGIIGENVHVEKAKDTTIIKRLGFSKCRLSIAVPRSMEFTENGWLNGKKVATSYPVILGKYLEDNGIDAEIHEISGSVEIAPGIGLADAICDIVSTGTTLMSNGLKEVTTVMKSEAVLISGGNLDPEVEELLKQLLFRIEAVQKAANNKYILLNAPSDNVDSIKQVLPGMKSPTVLPLAESGWSSIHSVMDENDFWGKIDTLKSLGAEGILVVPIEKMIL